MKKLYLLLFFLLLVAFNSSGQTSTETFADEVERSTTFTDNGQQFIISTQSGGTFWIRDHSTNISGYGDDYYITNDFYNDNAPPKFTIATSDNAKFRLKSFYLSGLYDGVLTITGKLAGNQVFTVSAAYPSYPNYGLIDMSAFGGQNNSNAIIDSYIISSTSSSAYVFWMDNITWQKTGINPSVSSLPTFYVCPGNIAASDYKSFVVSGTLLTSQLNVTAPTGYQVAVNVGGWGNSIPLGQSGGTVNPFTIYVRVAPNAGGTPSGNITLSSTGSPSMYIAVNSANTTINSNPANRTVCPNNAATFSATATGATSYQWQVSTDGGTNYLNLQNNAGYSGVTTNVLTVVGITAGMNNSKYRIAAYNGACTVNSTPAMLTVSTIVIASSQTNPTCSGSYDGSISVGAIGGTAPYYYSWSFSGYTGSNLVGIPANNYTVTVTDNTGCTASKNFTLTAPVITGTRIVSPVTCYGGSNGYINLTPSGGVQPYSFLWENGATSEDRVGLIAGTYSVTIKDANGCTGTVNNIVVSQSAVISGTTVVTNANCNGGAGTIDLTPSGGSGPYTFNWGNATTEDRTGLAAGTYSVTITDNNGCTGTVNNITITQPNVLTGATVVTNACYGQNNGSINLTPTGGTAPYTFNWGTITTEDRTALAAGTYTCTITDAHGCTVTVSPVVQSGTQIYGTTVITNVDCFSDSSGSINLTPSGGTGPYSFLWNTGATTKDRTGLAAGNYTCTITDSKGCTGTVTVTIAQPAAPVSATTQITNQTCFGINNGSIDLTPTGGTPGFYTYNWGSGINTQDRSGLAPGTYTCIVTDINGCQGTVTVTVQPATEITASTTIVQPTCFGGTDGSVNLTVSGGTPPYSFSWSDGAITKDRATIAAGTYSITITDNNGCSVTFPVTVGTTTVVSGTTVVTNVKCYGGNTATINLTPTGGTGPYTFLWNTGATTEDRTGLAVGSYSVIITDSKGCAGTVNNIFVTQPTAITVSGTQTDVLCFGGSSGSATVTVTGGTGGYTYSWSPSGGTAATASGLSAGTYSVRVRDANLCEINHSFTITEPVQLTDTDTQTNVSCFGGSNGSASVDVTGGTGSYTYLWSPSGGTTATASGLTAGIYNVRIRDANLCEINRSFTITEPVALSTSGSQVNVLCNGQSNGSATVTATGGTGTYAYLWLSTGATAATASGLAAGTYTVRVRDANLCETFQSYTITEPVVLTAATTQVDVLCNGGTGSATVIPTGGTIGYTYLWNTTPAQITATATGLVAGNYNVVVTDNYGCTVTKSVTITQPTVLTATTTQANVLCNGGTGSATVIPTGGTIGYTYSWNTTPVQTTATATGLTAGLYNVIVTDANGCSVTRSVTITQPIALEAITAQINASCNGGTGYAVIAVSGGTPAYTYLWNSVPAQASAIATGLTAGTYSVVVTDANGCSVTKSVTITQPVALTATTTQLNVLCNGDTGSATVMPTGGTTGYAYSWSTIPVQTTPTATGLIAGTYNAVVTDANGCYIIKTVTITQPTLLKATTTQVNVLCNGGTGSATIIPSGGTTGYTYSWSTIPAQTTATATNLAAGTYNVVVTDANGCSVTKSVTITQPAVLAATTTQVNVLCNGGTGSATVTPTGGTTGYTYSWSTIPAQTSVTATNLAAGTYNVVVTDANGCSVTETVNITQPTVLAATTTQVNVLCNSGTGSAMVTPAGGTTDYTYSWNTIPAQTTATATNLAAGTYNVVVTDANGCSVTRSVTITQPTVLAATTTQVNVLCNGGTGSATVTPTGGTTGYTYSWSTIPAQTTATATGLIAGTYNVVVTDANGCSVTETVNITQPTVLAATTTQVNVSCNGGTNASAIVTATGGTGTYTYAWLPSGGTAATATNLAAGTYNVVVTDTNGCSVTKPITITQPTVLTATTTQVNVLCNGGTGSATVTPTGGTTGYTYSWNTTPVQTTATATGLVAGAYNVVVTDANGCSVTKSVTITQPTVLTATTTQVNVSCNGGTNASAIVTATGGTGTYTYMWSPSGGTAATASGLAAGTYNVLVTDANGCSVTTPVTITQPTVLAATTTKVDVLCNGGTGSATVTPTGGTTGYTYSWNTTPVQTTATATGLVAGTYNVVVTDANGCSVTKPITITQPTVLAATTTKVDVLCNDGTGLATVIPTGGTGTYTYVWSPSGGTAATASGLAAGTYNVLVTDANGCSLTTPVTITQPTVLAATTTQVNVSCNGGTNALAIVTAIGGTGTYTYVWSPSGGTAATASGLAAGTYNVLVTDANGCSLTTPITITQPTVLAATTTQVNVLCNGGTGSATVTPTGGTTGYTYSWNTTPVQTTATATGLVAGTYNVVVTDANGCSVAEEVIISQPETLTSVTSYSNALCNGAADASAEITLSGGTAPYTYSWSNGNATPTVSDLTAGTYSVTVTDANGCSVFEEVVITEPLAILIDVQPADVVTNTGNTAQFMAITANADSYQWFVSEDGDSWTAINDGGIQPVYSGTEANILTLDNVPALFNGYLYKLQLAIGTDCSVFTDVAILTVNNVLEAVNDDFSSSPIPEGTEGITGDVTANDLFNNLPLNNSDILITVVDNGGLDGVTIDADGSITVPATGSAGTYTITYQICDITSANNCTTAEVIVVVAAVAAVHQVKDIRFTVYPNPASTLVFIKLSDFATGSNLKAALYDLNGRLVREDNVSSETFSIDVSRLESAIYILNITSDTANASKRIVVDKKS